MRVRIASTIAVIAATIGIASSVAGPIYSAFGGQSGPSSTSVQAGRIMK